jgi:hypothetical protein
VQQAKRTKPSRVVRIPRKHPQPFLPSLHFRGRPVLLQLLITLSLPIQKLRYLAIPKKDHLGRISTTESHRLHTVKVPVRWTLSRTSWPQQEVQRVLSRRCNREAEERQSAIWHQVRISFVAKKYLTLTRSQVEQTRTSLWISGKVPPRCNESI